MKKLFKLIGVIAFIAVIVFSFITCDNGTTADEPTPKPKPSPLTGTVSISGTAKVGQILTANTSLLGGSGTISYQWKRGETNIGTNSNIYTIQIADVGSTITVTVTRAGYSGSVVSNPTATITGLDNTVDLSVIITEAEEVKTQAKVDTAAGNVALNAYWVTQEVMTAFESAINTAIAALSSSSASQLDAAKTALQSAIITFKSAWQTGTKTSFTAEEKTALITDAKADKQGVKTAASGDDVSPLEYWVSESVLNELNAAITALENASGQSAIDSAYLALTNAINTFNATKKQGTKPDRTALNSAITAANTAKNSARVAANKNEVPVGLPWATSAQVEALRTAIESATAVVNNTNATKNGVDTAVSTLNAAITTFNAAVTSNGPGTFVAPTVTSVGVTPATATIIKNGTQLTQLFEATVSGTNNPAQTVIWSIEQINVNNGTTITQNGLLTVSASEALTTLTVRATSTVDNTKFGTATVTISTPVGSGQYTSKDVLGNSYSISIGSDVPASISARYARNARNAYQNDRVKMSVKGRDGRTRHVSGKVKTISTDGTLTIETDKGDEFTAVVDGNSLDSIASDGEGITLDEPVSYTDAQGNNVTSTELTPRTFDTIFLRANRWAVTDNNGPQRGEQYASGMSVLVKDFPTNVSRLVKGTHNRYTITISGTLDTTLSHVQIEVQGLTNDDKWVYLGGNEGSNQITITEGVFTRTVNLDIGNDASRSYDLLDYKEVILQFTEVLRYENDVHPEWLQDYGSIPADIPNGQIMATISDFKISLKDTAKAALAGNVSDFTYGYKEDGFSTEYRHAVWSLSADNIANARKLGAKFEFTLLDASNIETGTTKLVFVWQDPVRELWWQEETTISGWNEDTEKWEFDWDVASWNTVTNKISVNLSKIIKDPKFTDATAINFILGCWWINNGPCKNIDDFGIAGVSVIVPKPLNNITGNMGTCVPGYNSDSTPNQKQAVWKLNNTAYTSAKTPGAQLEIVFDNDLVVRAPTPVLYLVWQDEANNRWWPTSAEAGTDDVNLIIYQWKEVGGNTFKAGVTYDPTTKKIIIPLPAALETYSGFIAGGNKNLVLNCGWGVTDYINELGIVSANLVIGETGETVKSSHDAYNSNSDIPNLSSSVGYRIVNLPGVSGDLLKVVNPSGAEAWAVALSSLSSIKDQNRKITFSADVMRVGAAGTLNWQINNSDYPSVGTPISNAAASTWYNMSGTWTGTPTDDTPYLYLSTHENNSSTTTYYVKNFTITIEEAE